MHSLRPASVVAASTDTSRPAPRRRALGTCHATRAAQWSTPPPPQAHTLPLGQARPCNTGHVDQNLTALNLCVHQGERLAPNTKMARSHHATRSNGWKRHAHSVPPCQVGYVHAALLVQSVIVALQNTQREDDHHEPSTCRNAPSSLPAHRVVWPQVSAKAQHLRGTRVVTSPKAR